MDVINLSKYNLFFSKFKVTIDCLLIFFQILILSIFIKQTTLNYIMLGMHFLCSIIVTIMNIYRLLRDIKYVRDQIQLTSLEYHQLLYFNKRPYDIIKLVNLFRIFLQLAIVNIDVFYKNGYYVFYTIITIYFLIGIVQIFNSNNKIVANVTYDQVTQNDNQNNNVSYREIFLKSFIQENIPIIITDKIMLTLGIKSECIICLEEFCEGHLLRKLE